MRPTGKILERVYRVGQSGEYKKTHALFETPVLVEGEDGASVEWRDMDHPKPLSQYELLREEVTQP